MRKVRASPFPCVLLGLLLFAVGFAGLLSAGLMATLALVLGTLEVLTELARWTLLPSAALVIMGALCSVYGLFVLLPAARTQEFVPFDTIDNRALTVILTAFNDELSIGRCVREFLAHPLVHAVVVIDNNSRDATSRVAAAAGAKVILEQQPGYGRCVYRGLCEGAAQTETDLTLLCEGDGTFSAFDIDKFLAYIPHAEIVNGTRIVEQLRDKQTQLTTFMYYGNFAVGKLLEVKHMGKGTFTDVGTTYKLCRNGALSRLLPKLNPAINLEFNAHFLDTALDHGLTVLECPVTFHQRIGVSKGGNTDDRRALRVGLRMIWGLLFSW